MSTQQQRIESFPSHVARRTANFVRRPNHEDGTFDSFCCACYATVGAHETEADLEWREDEHVCNAQTQELFRK